MIAENDNTWEFYRDARGEWRWRKTDPKNGQSTGFSNEAYVNRTDCVKNAKLNGYTKRN